MIEGPPLRRELRLQCWFEDELLLVVPRGHEWAGLASIAPQKLSASPLVMRERGSGSCRVVERGLQKADLRLASLGVVMELDSTAAILSCIEAGLGVGFVSEWAVGRRSSAGTLSTLRLTGSSISRSFSFLTPPGPAPTAASAMLRFLQDRVPPTPSHTL